MIDPARVSVSRRRFLEGAVALSGTLLLPTGYGWAQDGKYAVSDPAKAAIESSPLIYITPIRSDGSESHCHGEVWFASEGLDLLIVTPRDFWRSRAIRQGLDRARIWVGDFGVWKKSHGRFKTAPTFLAQAELITSNASLVKRTLELMRVKYAKTGWETYGPVFNKELRNGDRVLIRYRPVAA
jgi:hypothetical protein